MATARLKVVQERAARFLVLLLFGGLSLAIAAGRPSVASTTVHGAMPERGGWQPGHLTTRVGHPLRLHLTSDDVVHSFAVGAGPDGRAYAMAPVDVYPGEVTELTLTFDMPGTYTFYCTRWCGANHWRMRGTIQVSGKSDAVPESPAPPLYMQLGLDIDAPHPASIVPTETPSAARGRRLGVNYPAELLGRDTYMTMSPVDVWRALRDVPELAYLDDGALWDAVAYLWQQNSTPEKLALGQRLYSQNCAACHGESGAGDGIFTQTVVGGMPAMRGHTVEPATDFTNPDLLAASNALLQGKILRGGMGTGMPGWGAIFTNEELQALLDYLWTFQFAVDGQVDPYPGGNHAP